MLPTRLQGFLLYGMLVFILLGMIFSPVPAEAFPHDFSSEKQHTPNGMITEASFFS